jgi:chromate transport protein ChrA
MTAIFYGVSPAVIALILHSCSRLSKLGMEDWLQWVIATICFVITIVFRAQVAVLFVGAGIVGILYYGSFLRRRNKAPPASGAFALIPISAVAAKPATTSTLGQLFTFFFKAGSLTFGSGLVIVPFLEKGLVQQTGRLNGREFFVAVAVGMLSPGHHRDVCRLSGGRLLGIVGRNCRNFPTFVPAHSFCCTDPYSASQQFARTRVRQRGLRSRHRNDLRILRAVGQNCHWRLAYRLDRIRQSCRLVQVRGRQSVAGRRNRRYRLDRLPTAPTTLGSPAIGKMGQPARNIPLLFRFAPTDEACVRRSS